MEIKVTCMSVAELFVLALSSLAFSSLIRVVSLVLQVRERGECASSEPVQLVFEEHDLLFLLFDDVEELTLVGDLLDFRLGV